MSTGAIMLSRMSVIVVLLASALSGQTAPDNAPSATATPTPFVLGSTRLSSDDVFAPNFDPACRCDRNAGPRMSGGPVFSLSIRAIGDATVMAISGHMEVEITFTNISKRAIYIPSLDAGEEYIFDVTGPDGKSPERVPHSVIRSKDEAIPRVPPVLLSPNQSHKSTLGIDAYYQTCALGSYSVQVAERFPPRSAAAKWCQTRFRSWLYMTR